MGRYYFFIILLTAAGLILWRTGTAETLWERLAPSDAAEPTSVEEERLLVQCVTIMTFETQKTANPDCVRSDTREAILPVAGGKALIITDVTMTVSQPGRCRAKIYPARNNTVVYGTNFLDITAVYDRTTHLSFKAPVIYAVPGEEIAIDARNCDVPVSYNMQGYLIPHDGQDRRSED